MNKYRIFVIIAVVFLLNINATAALRIYLLPSAQEVKVMTLFSIARFDGLESEINQIANIQIDESVFNDGYIDRKELYKFIRSKTKNPFLIYGSSVKINKKNILNDNTNYVLLIKRNTLVNVTVKNNGIKVITKGISLSKGYLNKKIKIKLDSGKLVSAIVKSKKEVFIEL